jgi:hypothetical protein
MAETRNADMSAITVSAKTLGEVLGIGDRMVRHLADEGILVKNSHGKYLLMKSVKNYILRVKAAKSGKHVESDLDEALDLDAEKAKHEHVKRIISEIQLSLIQGRVHKAEDVERVITDMLARFKSKLEAMPSKLAMRLERKDRTEIQRILFNEVRAALKELSEYNPADYYSDEHIEVGEDAVYALGVDEDAKESQ